MSDSLQVRSAVAADAVVVARIGREGVATQYIGLVDPAAVEAAVQQTYSVNAIAACIERCSGAELAEFLVAERDGMANRCLGIYATVSSPGTIGVGDEIVVRRPASPSRPTAMTRVGARSLKRGVLRAAHAMMPKE